MIYCKKCRLKNAINIIRKILDTTKVIRTRSLESTIEKYKPYVISTLLSTLSLF